MRAIFQVQAPGGLYLEGRFNEGFFALPIWGAYIWRGLFSDFTVLFRLCVAREFAHDVHHMRCESRFDFFSCLFQSKAKAIYPKAVKKVINFNGYIARHPWIQNINQIIKLSIV